MSSASGTSASNSFQPTGHSNSTSATRASSPASSFTSTASEAYQDHAKINTSTTTGSMSTSSVSPPTTSKPHIAKNVMATERALTMYTSLPNEVMNPGLHAAAKDIIAMGNKLSSKKSILLSREQVLSNVSDYASRYPEHPLPPDPNLLSLRARSSKTFWSTAVLKASKLDPESRDGFTWTPQKGYEDMFLGSGEDELLTRVMMRYILLQQHAEALQYMPGNMPSLELLDRYFQGAPEPTTLGTLHQYYCCVKDIAEFRRRIQHFCVFDRETAMYTRKPIPGDKDIEDVLSHKPRTTETLINQYRGRVGSIEEVYRTIRRTSKPDATTGKQIPHSTQPPDALDVYQQLDADGMSFKAIMALFPNRIWCPPVFREDLKAVAYPAKPDPVMPIGLTYNDYSVEQIWYPLQRDGKGGFLSVELSKAYTELVSQYDELMYPCPTLEQIVAAVGLHGSTIGEMFTVFGKHLEKHFELFETRLREVGEWDQKTGRVWLLIDEDDVTEEVRWRGGVVQGDENELYNEFVGSEMPPLGQELVDYHRAMLEYQPTLGSEYGGLDYMPQHIESLAQARDPDSKVEVEEQATTHLQQDIKREHDSDRDDALEHHMPVQKQADTNTFIKNDYPTQAGFFTNHVPKEQLQAYAKTLIKSNYPSQAESVSNHVPEEQSQAVNNIFVKNDYANQAGFFTNHIPREQPQAFTNIFIKNDNTTQAESSAEYVPKEQPQAVTNTFVKNDYANQAEFFTNHIPREQPQAVTNTSIENENSQQTGSSAEPVLEEQPRVDTSAQSVKRKRSLHQNVAAEPDSARPIKRRRSGRV